MLKRGLLKLPRRHARRRTRLSRALARAGRFYWQCYEAPGYDLARNGEAFLINRVAAAGGTCFFDVGANTGQWTRRALSAASDACVHSFEIAGPTFEEFRNRLGHDKRVRANGFGLSDSEGVVELDYFPEKNAVTTAVRGMDIHSGRRAQALQSWAMPGDDYCRANNVGRVHLLKIDTEGAEPKVLRGFSRMLGEGRIDVIQFEYGMANIYTRFLLIDFYEYLVPFGFYIGKLYPEGVRFKEYEPQDEDFLGPNYVALHKSRSDLRHSIATASM